MWPRPSRFSLASILEASRCAASPLSSPPGAFLAQLRVVSDRSKRPPRKHLLIATEKEKKKKNHRYYFKVGPYEARLHGSYVCDFVALWKGDVIERNWEMRVPDGFWQDSP